MEGHWRALTKPMQMQGEYVNATQKDLWPKPGLYFCKDILEEYFIRMLHSVKSVTFQLYLKVSAGETMYEQNKNVSGPTNSIIFSALPLLPLQAGPHCYSAVHSDLCSGLRHVVGRDSSGHSVQHQKVSRLHSSLPLFPAGQPCMALKA